MCKSTGAENDGHILQPMFSASRIEQLFPASHTIEGFDGKGYGLLPQLDGAPDPPSAENHLYSSLNLIDSILNGPASLLSSKHAPSPAELAAAPTVRDGHLAYETNVHGFRSETPGSPLSTISTSSTGQWRHPPIRFQHLAAFMQLGDSLCEQERAAVNLWKLASKEQLDWNEHLDRSEMLRETFAALSVEREDETADATGSTGPTATTPSSQKAVNTEMRKHDIAEGRVGGSVEQEASKSTADDVHRVPASNGMMEVDEGALAKMAGLSKSDCRGRDLTFVLAHVRAQQQRRAPATNL